MRNGYFTINVLKDIRKDTPEDRHAAWVSFGISFATAAASIASTIAFERLYLGCIEVGGAALTWLFATFCSRYVVQRLYNPTNSKKTKAITSPEESKMHTQELREAILEGIQQHSQEEDLYMAVFNTWLIGKGFSPLFFAKLTLASDRTYSDEVTDTAPLLSVNPV